MSRSAIAAGQLPLRPLKPHRQRPISTQDSTALAMLGNAMIHESGADNENAF
jgi:hypothetical protein